MTIQTEAMRLAKTEQAMARRDHKMNALAAQQEQSFSEVAEAKAALALAILRERGVLDLPSVQLTTLLSSLDISTAKAVHGAIIAAAPEASAERPVPSDAAVSVSVQLSHNAAETKRNLLTDAGLRWNGKAGRWVGMVDRSHVTELEAAFGDRVSVKPEAQSADAAPGSAPAAEDVRVDAPGLIEPAEEPVVDR
jgi:hypothetical protein